MTEPVVSPDPPAQAQEIERTFLLHIGLEVYRVYGSDRLGWSLDSGDLHAHVAAQFRYQSLAELFFAIVNFSIAQNGRA